MTRLLLALCPRAWRRRYGDEFAALLEDSRMTPRVVLDIFGLALRLHARAHRRALALLGCVLLSAGVEYLARAGHLADNVLWPPTSATRLLALAALAAPWAALATGPLRRRLPGWS